MNLERNPDKKSNVKELDPKNLESAEILEHKETQENKKPKLSSEERLKNTEGKSQANQKEIKRLTELTEKTKGEINDIRKKMGLPPTEEDPPSVSAERDRVKKLEKEQEELEKQKEDIVNEQERERMIREEEAKIWQSATEWLFEDFKSLDKQEFEAILQTGKTQEGKVFKAKSGFDLHEPDTAKIMANAFKNGIKLFSEILDDVKKIKTSEKFANDIREAAESQVNRKINEAKREAWIEQLEKEETPEQKAEREKNAGHNSRLDKFLGEDD